MTTAMETAFQYMRAFEMAFVSGDWDLLLPFFHEDAVHEIRGGAMPVGVGGRGRAAIVAGLRGGVERIDRRFDARIPEIVEGPRTTPDGTWMRFALTLRRHGAGELVIHGEHVTRCRDGRIESLVETLPAGEAARVQAWMAAHDDALKPAGSPFDPAGMAVHAAALEASSSRSLVRCYGGAKSEADVGAALAVCDDDFTIETVSLGIASTDRAGTAVQLAGFFAAFPDYRVAIDGLATGPGTVACWGEATMTLAGDFVGIPATGRTARVPVFCQFDVGAGLRRERFFFDLATLAAGIGVPVEALSAAGAALRPAQDVA